MIIRNGKVLIGREFVETDVAFDDRISEIAAELTGGEEFDAAGGWVLPGLVDIHSHGAVGEDFSDGNPAGLQPMADYYAANGVTRYLATTMTLPEKELTAAVEVIRAFRPERGAKCAGIHMEGPFLNYAKRGAQAAEHLHRPDARMFHRLNAASGGLVKLVTVACEEDGAMDFIREVSPVCTVSLGHTTADYDTAMAAFAAGATHVTHLYNGMPPLHHRQPGVIGAAMDAGASVELICDGLHIHPSVVRATYAMFGQQLNLVSDCLRCAGMPEGDYELGGQPIEVRKGRATLRGTDTLAGASVSLLGGVRNAAAFGIPLSHAAYAASTAPAKAAGLVGVGAIQVGNCADFVVLNQDLELVAVFVDGVPQETVSSRGTGTGSAYT